VKATAGDRRAQVRFDVVGAFWGQLELDEQTRICNVNTTGVLIDSSVPAALDSEQTIRVIVEGQRVSVDARVRHVRPIADSFGIMRYFIGLEFVSPPEPVLQSIEQLSENI
jgi:PilZ domain